ncbi:MAG: hypothetical protein RLZZ69_427, partial [Cyanobacteriota bacterium]
MFAAQVMFDVRMAYITIAVVILYQVLSIKHQVSRGNILNTLYLMLYVFFI